MTHTELVHKLNELRNLPAETEVFEFKEARNNYDLNKLGKYFSALSNEANLKGRHNAWLIFGIKDKGRTIVGSWFRQSRKDLDSLKGELANKTTNRITFIEIHELHLPEGRVLMFEIPAAPKGVPIAFDGHYYGRDGEELSPLNLEEIERIRNQAANDWSAVIVPDATIDDLDPTAIEKARENYKNKFPEQAKDVDRWDDITFLNKAKVIQKGKITRAAIILLGKSESEHFITPAEAKIRWLLNCIAHQDYTKAGRINVVEMEDQLIFTNLGSFIPGSVEKVVKEDAPEEHYRNRFLATAMFNLKMVDTVGGGIRKMFDYQRERFFPMPEYVLSEARVKVTVIGKVLDMEFAKVLARNPKLSLEQIIMLDKVQKKKVLSDTEIDHLRSKRLIEGRKPNFHVSSDVAARTNLQADYVKTRGLKDDHFKKLILEYLDKYKQASKDDIDKLLLDILPGVLDEQQRKNKIHNLVCAMSNKDKTIKNQGTNRYPKWVKLDKV